MSGGAFDYAQYRIDDIVARIEEEIESATCERPPLVREAKVGVKENRGDGWRYPMHLHSFRTLSSAELHFVGLGYDTPALKAHSFRSGMKTQTDASR